MKHAAFTYLSIFAYLLLSACDPIMVLHAHVRSVPCPSTLRGLPSDQPATYTDLPGARLAYVCPYTKNDWTLGVSDVHGHVAWGAAGFWEDECWIKVDSPNGTHRPQTLDVGELCDAKNCHYLTLNIDMVPIESRSCRAEAPSSQAAPSHADGAGK